MQDQARCMDSGGMIAATRFDKLYVPAVHERAAMSVADGYAPVTGSAFVMAH